MPASVTPSENSSSVSPRPSSADASRHFHVWNAPSIVAVASSFTSSPDARSRKGATCAQLTYRMRRVPSS